MLICGGQSTSRGLKTSFRLNYVSSALAGKYPIIPFSPSSPERFRSEHEVVRIFAQSTREVLRPITYLDTGLGLPQRCVSVINVFHTIHRIDRICLRR